MTSMFYTQALMSITDGIEYIDGTTYEFNTTITSTNGTAFIEYDGSNTTIFESTVTDVYNFTFNDTVVGAKPYYFGSWGNGTDNNFNTTLGLFHHSVNATPAADNEFPQFNDETVNPANNSAYLESRIYEFNVTLNSTNGTVIFDFSGTSYPSIQVQATNLTGNIFNASVFDLPVGNWTYNYTSWGNGTDALQNSSVNYGYTVSKATPDIRTFINGNRADLSTTNNTVINITGVLQIGVGDINVTINGTQVAAGATHQTNITQFLFAGVFTANTSIQESQNFTSARESWVITISLAVPQNYWFSIRSEVDKLYRSFAVDRNDNVEIGQRSNLTIGDLTLFVNPISNRIGIGTLFPQQTLNVVGNANITGNTFIGGNLNISGCLHYNVGGTPTKLGDCI